MKRAPSNQRCGAIILLMTVLLPVLLIIAGFAINLAYMELARTEMQIASDAGTRAACRTFARTDSEAQAVKAAQDVVAANPVMGKSIKVKKTDLVFGASVRSSPSSRYVFSAGTTPYNSARLTLDAGGSGGLLNPIRMAGSATKFNPVQIAAATQAELDVSLVVDRSGSMAYASNEVTDPPPTVPPATAPSGWFFGNPVPPKSRWLDAVDAVDAFLAILKKSQALENVGLTTYSTEAKIDVQLTQNYKDISDALNVYSSAFQSGGTNIGDGIGFGVNNILTSPNSRTWATRVMIVLTDGIHNWGPDPTTMTQYAVDSSTIVYTVTFSDEADKAKLKSVADACGGIHYHATDLKTLKDAFEEIARNLPVLLTE
jgi:Flp pilus assembly protein TadG